jgi:hypothetical protein
MLRSIGISFLQNPHGFFLGPEVPIIAKDLVRTKEYHRNCGTVVFVGGEVKEL